LSSQHGDFGLGLDQKQLFRIVPATIIALIPVE
jgi:hypothetical protein